MTLTKFTASMAIVLTFAAPAASAIVEAAAAVPQAAGLGWQAYRAPNAIRYPQRNLDPRLSGLYGPYWSGGQQEHTSPHK